ncbi:MAG: glycosyltransferase family 2 protein [Prevotellaceae bacterium]|jgi:GT2 family glycosyltransferase|nr:glycosyltransferase family 2 protein [Prevotellaceae bacterium]
MKLSVVLLTWNVEKYIAPCLDSLLSSIKHLDFEIIIVDNYSTDNSLSLLEKYRSERISIIKNAENRGVATARNQALKLVQGAFIWLLDIDTVVNQAAIDQLLLQMRENPQTGISACKLTAEDGSVQMSCRKFPSIRYKLYNILEERGINIKSNQSQFYKKQMNGNVAFEVDYVIGACQLVRKTALDEVGLLDEHIFYGPEDADFCLRMKRRNWTTVYLPTVSIIHHYQQISRKKLFSKMSFLHLKGLIYYFWKWKK